MRQGGVEGVGSGDAINSGGTVMALFGLATCIEWISEIRNYSFFICHFLATNLRISSTISSIIGSDVRSYDGLAMSKLLQSTFSLEWEKIASGKFGIRLGLGLTDRRPAADDLRYDVVGSGRYLDYYCIQQ